ncbi:hypothetical protein GCM10009551_106270 [Nocardiopsis tropica]
MVLQKQVPIGPAVALLTAPDPAAPAGAGARLPATAAEGRAAGAADRPRPRFRTRSGTGSGTRVRPSSPAASGTSETAPPTVGRPLVAVPDPDRPAPPASGAATAGSGTCEGSTRG